MEQTTFNLPALALRGLTIFPTCILSFDVEREASIQALERAMEGDQRIFLVTQRELHTTLPQEKDLYPMGTVSVIRQIFRTGETTVRVLAEGQCRARLCRLWRTEPFLQVNVEEVKETTEKMPKVRIEALLRQARTAFGAYAALMPRRNENLEVAVLEDNDPGHLADFIAQNMPLPYPAKQEILNTVHPFVRLRELTTVLMRETEVVSFQQGLEEDMRQEIGQLQRDNLLREQIRLMQQELGDSEDDELEEYREQILELGLEAEIEQKLLKEVRRLAKQHPGSAEAALIRNYLDVCLEMPWGEETPERLSVEHVRRALERDHYGLEKVKQRILEHIAVRELNPEGRGQIICLVGPPGVGKTSIAIPIAAALNRKLARVSLGGIRDEADIRGHRRTYIGSMPGRIAHAISQCGSMNPLLLLDEIDKIGNDQRGDPASAMLEVLDREQNSAFRDHFLEIPLDLSRVMFITTANTTSTIPRPLLDRMEIIEMSSYTDEEKVQIARRHLLPKQLKESGLTGHNLRISDDMLRRVIADYTRESGVRDLERQINRLCRKTAMSMVTTGARRVTVTEGNLESLLGPGRFSMPEREEYPVGVVNGLAWTEAGGELLEVEVNVLEGSGKLELTGNLGDVMKESAQTAVSCIRSRGGALGVSADFYKTKDIHIHFPEGAVPKDGPSAGIAVATAVMSALTGRRVRHTAAMTGEITLRGRVLAIGGLREKTMAALRNGITTVIIPSANQKDLAEIDPLVREQLRFVPVRQVEQVWQEALLPAVDA